ncbi:hypothetical protein HNQ80_002059 [Anaerosolibacter carboniphilus]|uniref:Uncharacterized protein n=1 Tax=Anaerosolibacter carboniphilus TaxID=1417629 RepID=A0A841KUU5_9FIRM|nr:hypothetical protein [Anaerosolibacter carboniphilus]MBB6215968.1 hypothetical protein [Anaerosolibacter carboniphilus]
MSIHHDIHPFLEGTCSVQILSDSLHAPIYGCTLAIEDSKLIIRPHILFDNFADELLLSDLETLEFNGSDLIVLKVNSSSNLKTLTIVKEKY